MREVLVPGLAAAWLLFAGGTAGAGWIVEEVDPDFPADRVVYFHAGEKVRVEGFVHGLLFLLDLHAGEGYIVDEERGLYAGGGLDKITKAMATARKGKADGGNGEDGADAAPAAAMPGLRIARLEGEEEVAGFKTRRFRVFLEDLLVEELWVAPALAAGPAGRWGSVKEVLEAMTGATAGEDFAPGYEEEDAYRQLLKEGYLMRRITYFRGEEHRVEVVRAEERSLAPAVFQVPPGLERSRYRRLFFGKK